MSQQPTQSDSRPSSRRSSDDEESLPGGRKPSAANADRQSLKEFTYSPLLGSGSIRLLRLMPHRDRAASVQCQMFEYPLQELGEGSHLYEALSYVWGDSNERLTISVNECRFHVTKNLHAALMHLRDRYFERIIWIDALCIDQKHETEKGQQIRYMAEIYSKAVRVIVWLGEAEDNGDWALEEMQRLVDDMSAGPTDVAQSKHAILTLLERRWFQRIWVLQEVAAARNILIKCGSTDISGYAFCEAITSSYNLLSDATAHLRNRIFTVATLMRGSVLRPKKALRLSDGFSLAIRPLGELVDMYHSHEASERRDKIFALLGMSSDDIGLDATNYHETEWDKLFCSLIRFLLGDDVTVKTLVGSEVAVIETHGVIFGKVSKVGNSTRNDRQKVTIMSKHSDKSFRREREVTFQTSANSVQTGDLICSIGNQERLIVMRLCGDHFSVVRIVAPVQPTEMGDGSDSCNLRLIWDWKSPQESPSTQTQEKDSLHRPGDGMGLELCSTRVERLLDIIAVLFQAQEFQEAASRFPEVIELCETGIGKYEMFTLSVLDRLALLYTRMRYWDEAYGLFDQVIKTRAEVQGAYHVDTITTLVAAMNNAKSMYKYSHDSSDKSPMLAVTAGRSLWDQEQNDMKKKSFLEAAKDIEVLKKRVEQGDFAGSLQNMASTIIRSCDEKILMILLNLRRDEFKATSELLTIAAHNTFRGKAMMAFLLEEYAAEVEITEATLVAVMKNRLQGEDLLVFILENHAQDVKLTEKVVIAASSRSSLMTLLLEKGGHDVKVSEKVLLAALKHSNNKEMVKLFLEKRAGDIKLTEKIMVAAAKSDQNKYLIALLLAERGNEVKITETVLIAAASSDHSKGVMTLLLEKRGRDIRITENVLVAAASGGFESYDVMKLLLERRGGEFKITEKVLVATARGMCSERVMDLLLSERADDFSITENILVAAAGGHNSDDVMALLLENRGSEVKITEKVVIAAAASETSQSTMELLLVERGDEVKITEKVLEAAAGSSENWVVMELLLGKCDREVKITEATLLAAVNSEYSQDVMEILLKERRGEIKITEEVLRRAAGNDAETMELLFENFGDEIKVTEGVVMAAVENVFYGRAMLRVLLDHQHDYTITVLEERACVNAALWGQTDVLDFLCREECLVPPHDEWDWIARLFVAAGSGETEKVRTYLAQEAPPGTKKQWLVMPLWNACGNGHSEVIELLLQMKDVDMKAFIADGGRPPALWPVDAEEKEAVKWLMEAGAEPAKTEEYGDVMASIASKLGKEPAFFVMVA